MKVRSMLLVAITALVGGGLLLAPPAAAATPPGAPTNVSAVAANASATVSWQAPADDGGAAITGYTVTSSPGNVTKTVSGSTRSTTVTGLTNGTSYTFTVKATNSAGTGPASVPAAPVTPGAVPSAPRSVTATAGDHDVTVTWRAPSSNGGSAITAYRVTTTPGGTVVTTGGSATSTTVTGLTNGTSYTFTVAAVNSTGIGTASNPTAPVTPKGGPSAPQNVTATAGDKAITVKWAAPASNGGSAITAYTVTAQPGGRSVTTNGSARSATISGLTNGTAYTITVRAANATATGASASPSSAITPFGVPSAPTNVTAIAADRSVTVKWNPANDNGSPITKYTVSASPGTRTATTTGATTVLVTGLTNGVNYTFKVTATNARGTGPASAASAVARPFPINQVTRLAGVNRLATAIALSESNWASANIGASTTRSLAQAVVLARSDSFADALAGTPLAAKKVGPLLLTPATALDATVRAEIHRVLGAGRTVYLLGGTAAISATTESTLRADGYVVVRLAGGDRFATAVQIADVGLGNPTNQFLVTGMNYPDALAAGAAAAHVNGSILLTNDSVLDGNTALYLATHPGTRFAVGGKARDAFPGAEAIVGTDRFDTSVRVAKRFFNGPTQIGFTSGRGFADALSGSAHIASRGGPLLLVDTTLPFTVRSYLVEQRDNISYAFGYGGTKLLTDQVLNDVRVSMT